MLLFGCLDLRESLACGEPDVLLTARRVIVVVEVLAVTTLEGVLRNHDLKHLEHEVIPALRADHAEELARVRSVGAVRILKQSLVAVVKDCLHVVHQLLLEGADPSPAALAGHDGKDAALDRDHLEGLVGERLGHR